MTPLEHFHSYLDTVRREGRYRTFTDLERRADRPPFAIWRNNGACRKIVVGARTITSGWDAIPQLSMR